MSRAVVILNGQAARNRVASWAMTAPINTRVEFKESRRSLPQNSRMWAQLTDVARQVRWHGVKLSPDDWKLIFLSALKSEMRIVPNLDGTGFVNLGRSSSDLTKVEMGDLQELIAAFGAREGVVFGDEEVNSQGRSGANNPRAGAVHA
jgi:hypothetical protein